MTAKYIWVASWIRWMSDPAAPSAWGVYSSMFADLSEPKKIDKNAYTSEDRAYESLMEYIRTWQHTYDLHVIEHPGKTSDKFVEKM